MFHVSQIIFLLFNDLPTTLTITVAGIVDMVAGGDNKKENPRPPTEHGGKKVHSYSFWIS
jgi:hypothetical protein